MNIRSMRCAGLLAAMLAGWAGPAQALDWPNPAPAAAACQAPRHDGALMLDREARLSQFEGLGEECLKHLVMACSAAAGRQLLDTADAFSCSLGYEALLKRGFGGNFQAMLAWWRTRPAGAVQN